MQSRRRAFAFLVTAAAVAVTGTVAALAAQGTSRSSAATPKRGGHITIARIEDSTSFDKTNVFQNESIWLTEQINESLYEVGNDGTTLQPSARYYADTVNVGPGQRYDVIWTARVPGKFPLQKAGREAPLPSLHGSDGAYFAAASYISATWSQLMRLSKNALR